MDDPEDDPWNTPEVHKGHDHSKLNGNSNHVIANGQSSFRSSPSTNIGDQTLSQYVSAEPISSSVHGSRSGNDAVQGQAAWGFYGSSNASSGGGGFADGSQNITPNPSNTAHPFGGDGGAVDHSPGREPPTSVGRATSGRTGSSVEENIIVTLMPGKEGVFLFQHHNYEVASQRRGSKVIRRYSDFVWLLDCLHKRYPFRVLPLLPPKRVAVNGNHLSNDGAFIEKRRRGLARFLNALVRHPVLGQEQLVIMFLTVPTVCGTALSSLPFFLTKSSPSFMGLIWACRSLLCGGSKPQYLYKTSSPTVPCHRASKTPSRPLWRSYSAVRDPVSAALLSCTSTCATLWTGSSREPKAWPPTTPASPCRSRR